MAADSLCANGDNFDWDSEDDREIDNFRFSSSSCLSLPAVKATLLPVEANSGVGSSGTKVMDHFVSMGFSEKRVAEAIQANGEENEDLILETLVKNSETSSASSSGSEAIDHFVEMGFSKEMVSKVIRENGEENKDAILETLLTYKAIGKFPQEEPSDEQSHVDCDGWSSEDEGLLEDDYSGIDWSDDEESEKSEPDEGNTMLSLTKMGYTMDETSIAVERCGPNATIQELTDFIYAAQTSKAADAEFEVKPKIIHFDEDYPKHKKRTLYEYDMWKKKKQRRLEKERLAGGEDLIRLPLPMIGYGTPTIPGAVTHRTLPEIAHAPPFFFYENVALAPKGVWQTISRHLFDVEPEFVDSKHFCAAARKRGYIHNLPIQGRFPLLPMPPQTIFEAMPLTARWWPSWDQRTQLNCLQTCIASAKLTEKIRKFLENYNGDPPEHIKKYIIDQCRKWNLVWVGMNKVAPLEPDEVEMLLGFPRNHTRGVSRTDRYKSLGNSFQIDTVAYQLSVLKDLFPDGINVLSLFSGIGGAEVALHRLGIKLKNVVSVEISEVNRNIVRSWWDQTHQTGNLIHIDDVQKVSANQLEDLMMVIGGFDLVVGGSPCNNLTGSNRHTRDGLEGKESSLFFDYTRILDNVKRIMTAMR